MQKHKIPTDLCRFGEGVPQICVGSSYRGLFFRLGVWASFIEPFFNLLIPYMQLSILDGPWMMSHES